LQQEEPDDYVVATGVSHSVKEFAELAFNAVGLNWEDYVIVDERYLRPAEVPDLRGDASKARTKLGWIPDTSFEELVRMMVDADVEKYRRSGTERWPPEET
jgi:GDPmannose 4,6-dehydratase